jgi:hypothetical protein
MTPSSRPFYHSGTGLSLLLAMAINVIYLQNVDAEPHTLNHFTERSFLFLWPGQSQSAARLDLDAPLITDRPNFTEASRTVGKDVTQIEVGYTFSYDGSTSPHQSSHTYPEAALRHGILADWLELRLGQSFVTNDSPGNAGTELGNTYIGVKLGLVPQHGALPEISLVPSTYLPSGSGTARSIHALPGINLAYSWSLPQKSFLSGTTKLYRALGDNAGDSRTTSAQSAVLGSLLTPSLTCYIEWYGVFQDTTNGDASAHFTDTGLTWLYSRNIQYDIRFGTRLQGRFGEEVFAGLGVSRRFL